MNADLIPAAVIMGAVLVLEIGIRRIRGNGNNKTKMVVEELAKHRQALADLIEAPMACDGLSGEPCLPNCAVPPSTNNVPISFMARKAAKHSN